MKNLDEKIYDKVLEIVETTARQEEKLNSVDNHLEQINGKVHDHCGRIKILEGIKIKTVGIVIGVSVAVSAVWSVATLIVS